MARKRHEDSGDDASPTRVRTGTKVVLVAAGWVLLTLFLIGQFSSDTEQAGDRARLDTVAGADLDGDGDVDEVVEEEASDVNGDGIIEVGEGVEEGTATASTEEDGSSTDPPGSGSAPSGSSGSADGGASPGGAADDGGDGAGADAVPGAAPSGGTTATTSGAGSGGSTTTTARASGGSTGGGSSGTSSTTTTTSGGGSGGSSGSSTTTTTAAPSTASSPIILIVRARDERYEYPSGFSADLRLPVASQIRLDNVEANAGVRHSFTIPTFWDSGKIRSGDGTRTSPPLPQGSYTYTCTEHPVPMRGTITVG